MLDNGLERFIQKAVDGDWSPEVEAEYLHWADTVVKPKEGIATPEELAAFPPGELSARARQIGGARVNMGKAVNSFLRAMSSKVEDGPYAGKTVLENIHGWMLDSSLSGREIRRRFFTIAPTGSQVDVKIFSFMLLVAGRDDIVVIDRLQVAHFWDAVARQDEYGNSNIYDGFPSPGDKPKSFERAPNGWSTSPGMLTVLSGTRGVALYEAIEDVMIPVITKAYADIGRPEDGTPGVFHWETWVLDSGQEVGHTSLEALLNHEAGKPNPARGILVRHGKYDKGAYGTSIRINAEGRTEYLVENSKGQVFQMDAVAHDKFKAGSTPVINRALEAAFKRGDNDVKSIGLNGDRPWYRNEGVDASEFDARVAEYGREIDPGGAVLDGDAADGGGVDLEGPADGDLAAAGDGDAGVRGPDEGGAAGDLPEDSRPGVGGEVLRGGVGEDKRLAPVDLYRSTDYEAFEAAKVANTRSENFSPMSREDFDKSVVIMNEDGTVGALVGPDGYNHNLFNNSGIPGAGKEAKMQSTELGGRAGDCYDGHLPQLYSRFGFVEVARIKFVDEYAPDGWDFEKLGRPDVVFNAYDGGDPATLRDRYDTFEYKKTDNYIDDFDAGIELALQKAKEFEDADPSYSRADGPARTPAERPDLPVDEQPSTTRLAVSGINDPDSPSTLIHNWLVSRESLSEFYGRYQAKLKVLEESDPTDERTRRRGVSDRTMRRLRNQVSHAEEQVYLSFEAFVQEAFEGLDVKLIERGAGQYMDDPVEANVYVEVSGPRNVVEARSAALSAHLGQDGLLARHVVDELEIDPSMDQDAVVQSLMDDSGRLATARLTVPVGMLDDGAMDAVAAAFGEAKTGGSIVPVRVGADGASVDVVHVPEWGAPDAAEFYKRIQDIADDISEFSRERGKARVTISWWREDLVFANRDPDDARKNNARTYQDLVNRAPDDEYVGRTAPGLLRRPGSDPKAPVGDAGELAEGVEAQRGGPEGPDGGGLREAGDGQPGVGPADDAVESAQNDLEAATNKLREQLVSDGKIGRFDRVTSVSADRIFITKSGDAASQILPISDATHGAAERIVRLQARLSDAIDNPRPGVGERGGEVVDLDEHRYVASILEWVTEARSLANRIEADKFDLWEEISALDLDAAFMETQVGDSVKVNPDGSIDVEVSGYKDNPDPDATGPGPWETETLTIREPHPDILAAAVDLEQDLAADVKHSSGAV